MNRYRNLMTYEKQLLPAIYDLLRETFTLVDRNVEKQTLQQLLLDPLLEMYAETALRSLRAANQDPRLSMRQIIFSFFENEHVVKLPAGAQLSKLDRS